MKTKPLLILISILILATVTRLWNLSHFPPALFSDEVDAGYQAMVFNYQGTDYYGNYLPAHFHSFSDWRTPALIYSIAFFQKIGISPDISVRLPSAIFGLISILLIYLITKSTLPAFLLAISPWAIHYSRTGFEVSGMIMVLLAGIYFWQQYLRSKKLFSLLLAVLFFALAPYFYSTANLFLLIITVLALIIWFPQIKLISFKHLVAAFLFGIFLLLPIAVDTFQGRSGFRFSYIGIFTQPHREQVTDQLRYEDSLLNHRGELGVKTTLVSKLMHNKYQLVFQKFISNYVSSFSTDFLFLSGDGNIRHGFGGHGLLYLLDLFFVPFGIYIYFKKPDKLGRFFFWLLLLAPIPFSLTRDSLTPHATRLILMLPSLVYFAYLGLQRRPFFIVFYFFCFLNFAHYYLVHYPQASAASWHSSLKEAVILAGNPSNQNLYFSDSFEPFMPFFLFYNRYLPSDRTPITAHLKHYENDYFDGTALDDHYFFGHLNWSKAAQNPRAVFIISAAEYQTLSNQSDYTIVAATGKPYLSSPEFYLLTSHVQN